MKPENIFAEIFDQAENAANEIRAMISNEIENSRKMAAAYEAINKYGLNNGIIIHTPYGIMIAPAPAETTDIDEYINNIMKNLSKNNTYNKPEQQPVRHTCNCPCKTNSTDKADTANTADIQEYDLGIKKVIYNNNATIILFNDGTKSIAKCDETDSYNPTAGFAIALLKALIGKKTYHKLSTRFVHPEYEKIAENDSIATELCDILNQEYNTTSAESKTAVSEETSTEENIVATESKADTSEEVSTEENAADESTSENNANTEPAEPVKPERKKPETKTSAKKTTAGKTTTKKTTRTAKTDTK